jgi:hypothetical protein
MVPFILGSDPPCNVPGMPILAGKRSYHPANFPGLEKKIIWMFQGISNARWKAAWIESIIGVRPDGGRIVLLGIEHTVERSQRRLRIRLD